MYSLITESPVNTSESLLLSVSLRASLLTSNLFFKTMIYYELAPVHFFILYLETANKEFQL